MRQGFVQALEIRDQHFHAAAGESSANLPDGFRKNARAAQVIVVAVHAGDDGMLQAQRRDGFGYAAGLVPIDRPGPSLGDRAEPATPRADIAQQHERGGAMVPALPDIGALG